jgi:hypothetical protein
MQQSSVRYGFTDTMSVSFMPDTARTSLTDPSSPWFDPSFEVPVARTPLPSVELPVADVGIPLAELVENVCNGRSVRSAASVHIPPKSDFVSGGFQRGRALSHLTVEGDHVVFGEGGLLGLPFDEYLRSYPTADLVEIVRDQQSGIDGRRDLSAAYLAEVCPSDPAVLAARRHRVPSHGNSRRAGEHVQFLKETFQGNIASGAWRYVGTIEEVAAAGAMPLDFAAISVEPLKPRCCLDPRQMNLQTRSRATEYEGLGTVHSNCVGRPGTGATWDECSGYNHHLLHPDFADFFGILLFGCVLLAAALPFGWTLGGFYHQRHGMVYTGYLRLLGGELSQYLYGARARCLHTTLVRRLGPA